MPYDIISYERVSKNIIPIELYKNNIREFEIKTTNNDNTDIEGLADWIMVIEFIQKKPLIMNIKSIK